MQQSKCRDLTPEQADSIFFVGPGQSSKRAKLYCQTCPVKSECSQYAITYSEAGIWAGNTERDRDDLDSFIKDTLRMQAEAEGRLESRNTNDFIPQQRQLRSLDPEFDEVEQGLWGARLEALDPLYSLPNAHQEFAG